MTELASKLPVKAAIIRPDFLGKTVLKCKV